MLNGIVWIYCNCCLCQIPTARVWMVIVMFQIAPWSCQDVKGVILKENQTLTYNNLCWLVKIVKKYICIFNNSIVGGGGIWHSHTTILWSWLICVWIPDNRNHGCFVFSLFMVMPRTAVEVLVFVGWNGCFDRQKIVRFGEWFPRVMWCNWGWRNTRSFEGSEKSVAILRLPYDWIAANNSTTFPTSLNFLDLLNSVSSLFYFTCSGTY